MIFGRVQALWVGRQVLSDPAPIEVLLQRTFVHNMLASQQIGAPLLQHPATIGSVCCAGCLRVWTKCSSVGCWRQGMARHWERECGGEWPQSGAMPAAWPG